MDQATTLRRIMQERQGKVLADVDPARVCSFHTASSLPLARDVIRLVARALKRAKIRTVTHSGAPSEAVPNGAELVLLDAGSGLSEEKLRFHCPDFRSVLIVESDDVSIIHAYQQVKILHKRAGVKTLDVVVWVVDGSASGALAFTRLSETCSRFLDVKMNFLGAVPQAGKSLVDWKYGSRTDPDTENGIERIARNFL